MSNKKTVGKYLGKSILSYMVRSSLGCMVPQTIILLGTSLGGPLSTVERKQSRRFLEYVENNILTQLLSEPTREGGLVCGQRGTCG